MPNQFSFSTAAELFAAGSLLIVSCSHVVAAGAWSRLFQDAFKHPAAGLVIGLFTLLVGLPVLLAHWRWTGDLRSVVTIMGWAWTFKGSLYLLWPGAAARVGARHVPHPRRFIVAGVLGIALSLLALIGTFRAGDWQA
jgi:hypothetical protein